MCPKNKIGVLNFISYIFNEYPSNRERVLKEKIKGTELETEIRNNKVYDTLIPPISTKDLFKSNRFDLPMKYLYAQV